ncbi:hypothetical protein RF55_3043 [Lasius niger]|uniref:Uncharacterized protein n=1 Tax=Lasius niger TaxID=67767 RepID=A0A0J7L1V6_LASNI|nr:hypothetical protein RF55_3043 [Lasius niger]
MLLLVIVLFPCIVGVDLTRFRTRSEAAREETRVITRWHQPICIMPEKDVPPCSKLRKFQTEYEHRNTKEFVDGDESGQTKPIKLKISETSKGDEQQQQGIVSGVETWSSDLVGTLPLESTDLVIDDELTDPGRMSKLRLKTPELDDERQNGRSARRDRHLTGSTLEHTNAGPIHVTRVLDSPVTATLVARGCLPDIGLPLCASYQPSLTSEIVKPATEEDELIRSESHGTREPTIAVYESTDSRQDSTFLQKPPVAKHNSSQANDKPVLYKFHKNAEMIAKVKACFRYLLDLHTKLKETIKIKPEQLIKFNVDREIKTTTPALENDSKIDLLNLRMT